MTDPAINVEQVFRSEFGTSPIVARSPGRINLIGEHTDYNEGYVLPGAINKAAYAAIGKRDDMMIRLVSPAFSEAYEFHVEHILPTGKGWPDYILGVADQVARSGRQLTGFNMVINGDVPIGSGMSSSAALECAALYGMDKLFGFGYTKMEMAVMAQKGEQKYAGVMVGIMDQFASLFGRKGNVVELDCQSMEYNYRPFSFEGISILLLNTNVHHSLASSEYNQRREQCRKGVEMIQAHHDVGSLRDVTIHMLDKYVLPSDLQTYTRCRYVVEENLRVLQTCKALEEKDLESAGRLLYKSHEGLSKQYNVSCPELDFLVENIKGLDGVWGARMMGGGFGGCTINIIGQGKKQAILDHLSEPYFKKFGLELTAYEVSIEDGTSIINE